MNEEYRRHRHEQRPISTEITCSPAKRRFAIRFRHLCDPGMSLKEVFEYTLPIMLKREIPSDLARKAGIHSATIARWAKRIGVKPVRKGEFSNPQWKNIIVEYETDQAAMQRGHEVVVKKLRELQKMPMRDRMLRLLKQPRPKIHIY